MDTVLHCLPIGLELFQLRVHTRSKKHSLSKCILRSLCFELMNRFRDTLSIRRRRNWSRRLSDLFQSFPFAFCAWCFLMFLLIAEFHLFFLKVFHQTIISFSLFPCLINQACFEILKCQAYLKEIYWLVKESFLCELFSKHFLKCRYIL